MSKGGFKLRKSVKFSKIGENYARATTWASSLDLAELFVVWADKLFYYVSWFMYAVI